MGKMLDMISGWGIPNKAAALHQYCVSKATTLFISGDLVSSDWRAEEPEQKSDKSITDTGCTMS